MDITPAFVSSKAIHGLAVPSGEIEYFEDDQMAANSVDTEKITPSIFVFGQSLPIILPSV